MAQDGRPDDVARYVDALEILWRQGEADPTSYGAMIHQLELMREMTLGDEAIGPAAYALHSAVTLHSALGVLANPSVAALEDCSMASRDGAFFRLERLIRVHRFLSGRSGVKVKLSTPFRSEFLRIVCGKMPGELAGNV